MARSGLRPQRRSSTIARAARGDADSRRWLAAGIAGGTESEIGGIGVRSLVYWESYLLIALFACFGTISLRLALNPTDRNVYRSSVKPDA